MVGTTELLLLGGLALLLFGGKKVPEMMRGLGQGVKEFKQGMREGTNSPKENTNQQECDVTNVNTESETPSIVNSQSNNEEEAR